MVWRIAKKICAFIIIMVTVFGMADYFASSVFYAKATSDIDASAVIGPSTTIALSTDSVAFSILPSVDGTLGKSTALVVSTYTNNDFNCDVTMVAESPNLTNGTYTIPTLEEGTTYTDATFTNNSWGYQIGNGNYNGVLTESANLIKTISTMTGSTPDTTNIYFAAKFNTAVKAGDYTNTITFASTCTPEPRNYMQDQTQATLATLMPNVGDEVTLYDKRDEKSYTVAHLADGNYWMTQNLDFDIVNGGANLDHTNTDVPSNWEDAGNLTNTYATGDDTWDGSYTEPESYDPGDLCWDGTVNGHWDGTLSNETTACGNDKHMHIGNYYNWTAAVAMNDSRSYVDDEDGEDDVDQSICPTGWMLPKSGTTQTGSKSFQYLWGQYSSSFDDYTMMNSPLYFSYAGYWYGPSEGVGGGGSYWSSVVYNSAFAYALDFGVNDGVFLQHESDRSYAISVRCVARDTVQAYSVTVSMDAGVSSVTFAGDNTTQTATSASPTVSLKQGVSYTITANLASGYDFNGWSTTSGGSLNSTSTNPTTYTVNGTTTLGVTSASAAPAKTYMQNISAATLASLMPNVGDTTTLYDARDEKDYAITKLVDGYYWMTQNLRLGKGNGEIIALDSSNSDLPSGTTFNLKASGMGGNQPDATGDCNVGDWYPGDDDETETNTSHLCINTSDTETYGVYYNWYTATAGTGTYSVTSGEAAGSICPKGWILPPNSGERSYYNLLFTKGGLSNNAASATAMQTAPYNFPLSGYSYGEGISSVGSGGSFWSSTAGNDYYAYHLGFNSSSVYPQRNVNKGSGTSVRCVFGS